MNSLIFILPFGLISLAVAGVGLALFISPKSIMPYLKIGSSTGKSTNVKIGVPMGVRIFGLVLAILAILGIFWAYSMNQSFNQTSSNLPLGINSY